MTADILGRPKVSKRIRRLETQVLKGNASALVYDALHTSGQPLSPAIRAFFECHFHRDFSRVRVHTDECAAASAFATNTVAYTVGNHIVFGEGQYAPRTPEGKRLLAHELTHVVQQGRTAPVPLEFIPITTSGDAFEREADECARAIIVCAADPRQELRVMCKTDGPVFQGWYIDEQAPPGVHGQTHQLITRTVVNQADFAGWFHADCKELLIRGSAKPDLEKADAERRLGRLGAAAMYHGWGANEGVYRRNIAAFVLDAANHLNAKSQEADRRGLSADEERRCLVQGLRDMLGKALHATQDVAAHQTRCRVGPVQCTSEQMDDPSVNRLGWPVAFDNTRSVLRDLHARLNETSKRWVKNGPRSGGPTMLPPRDHRRP